MLSFLTRPSSAMDVKKVRFVAKPTIQIIERDSARDGSIWMQFARDRAQFQRRIEILRPILEPVLQSHVETCMKPFLRTQAHSAI